MRKCQTSKRRRFSIALTNPFIEAHSAAKTQEIRIKSRYAESAKSFACAIRL
jgi:hypothetical protein